MENIKYIMHSDVDDNNLCSEFDSEEEAIACAKRNIEDKTFVIKVTIEDGEVIDEENIWDYQVEEKDISELPSYVKQYALESLDCGHIENDVNEFLSVLKEDGFTLNDKQKEEAWKSYKDIAWEHNFNIDDVKEYPELLNLYFIKE